MSHPSEPLVELPPAILRKIGFESVTLEEALRLQNPSDEGFSVEDEGLARHLSEGVKWLFADCLNLNGYVNLVQAYRWRFAKMARRGRVTPRLRQDCRAIWGAASARIEEVLASWFRPEYDDRVVLPWEISPVNHLLVCRALDWSIQDAMNFMHTDAEVGNPFFPGGKLYKTQLRKPEYGFFEGVVIDRGEKTPPHGGFKSRPIPFDSYFGFGSKGNRRRLQDFGMPRTPQEEWWMTEYLPPLCWHFEEKGREIGRSVSVGGDISRLDLIAPEWSRPGPPKMIQIGRFPNGFTSTYAMIAYLRKLVASYGSPGHRDRSELASISRRFKKLIWAAAPLWYSCEYRPRLRMLIERDLATQHTTYWDPSADTFAASINYY